MQSDDLILILKVSVLQDAQVFGSKTICLRPVLLLTAAHYCLRKEEKDSQLLSLWVLRFSLISFINKPFPSLWSSLGSYAFLGGFICIRAQESVVWDSTLFPLEEAVEVSRWLGGEGRHIHCPHFSAQIKLSLLKSTR